jgi:DNA-binding NtrC family response regulator
MSTKTNDERPESELNTGAERLKEHYSDAEIKRQIDAYKLVSYIPPEKISIVYLDDENDALKNFKALYRIDFKVFTTTSPEEARKIIETNDIHIIVTDQRMPNITGVEFLTSIIKKHPDPIRILLTGYSDINAVIGAINKGQIYRYMSKPFAVEEMKNMLENAAEIYFLRKDKEQLLKDIARSNAQLEFMYRQKLLDI